MTTTLKQTNPLKDKALHSSQEESKLSSLFYTLSFIKEKKTRLHVIETHLLKMVKESFSLKEQDHISDKWNLILKQAYFNTGIKRNKLSKNKAAISVVLKELNSVILAIESHGFTPFDEMRSIDGDDAKNLVKYLLHDCDKTTKPITLKDLKPLLVKENPLFLNRVREEFQNVLNNLYHKINLGFEYHSHVIEMLVGHILSMFVLTEPEKDSHISIPVLMNNTQWKLVKYTFDKIPLTPKCFGTPICAYGLLPAIENTHPIMIFKSTPHPTGKSSTLSLIADFTPGFAVGGALYKMGRKKLHNWINKNYEEHQNQTIKIYGQSLGGALASHLACDISEKIEMHAFVPPGIFSNKSKGKEIKGKMYSHTSDLISLVNQHPEELTSIKVITEKPRKNPLLAHFKIFGCNKIILLNVNNKRENKRFIRKLFSGIHQVLCLPIFCIKSLFLCGVLISKKLSKIFKKNNV
jgi:hypothetical protein